MLNSTPLTSDLAPKQMENKVLKILKKNNENGLTITDLVKKSKLSRHAVKTALLRLEGAKKVYFKKIITGKFYFLNEDKK